MSSHLIILLGNSGFRILAECGMFLLYFSREACLISGLLRSNVFEAFRRGKGMDPGTVRSIRSLILRGSSAFFRRICDILKRNFMCGIEVRHEF